jgi:hypothetical protein
MSEEPTDEELDLQQQQLYDLGRHPGWKLFQEQLDAEASAMTRRIVIEPNSYEITLLQGKLQAIHMIRDEGDQPLRQRMIDEIESDVCARMERDEEAKAKARRKSAM